MSFGKFFKDALLPVAVWTCGVLLSCFVLTVAGAPVSIVVVAGWLGLPDGAVAAGGAVGSAAYLVGVFGAAFIELILARLRRAGKDDADA